jgi:hypothetical protein
MESETEGGKEVMVMGRQCFERGIFGSVNEKNFSVKIMEHIRKTISTEGYASFENVISLTEFKNVTNN